MDFGGDFFLCWLFFFQKILFGASGVWVKQNETLGGSALGRSKSQQSQESLSTTILDIEHTNPPTHTPFRDAHTIFQEVKQLQQIYLCIFQQSTTGFLVQKSQASTKLGCFQEKPLNSGRFINYQPPQLAGNYFFQQSTITFFRHFFAPCLNEVQQLICPAPWNFWRISGGRC